MTTTSNTTAPMSPEKKLSAESRSDTAEFTEWGRSRQARLAPALMNSLINLLTKCGLLKKDLDYHLVRASMVIIFLFFGYQKWFEYEAQTLIPYISNGPLIFWLYPVLASAARVGFWGFRNGYLAHSCSSASGIKIWEFWGPSVPVFHL